MNVSVVELITHHAALQQVVVVRKTSVKQTRDPALKLWSVSCKCTKPNPWKYTINLR